MDGIIGNCNIIEIPEPSLLKTVSFTFQCPYSEGGASATDVLLGYVTLPILPILDLRVIISDSSWDANGGSSSSTIDTIITVLLGSTTLTSGSVLWKSGYTVISGRTVSMSPFLSNPLKVQFKTRGYSTLCNIISTAFTVTVEYINLSFSA